MNYRGKRVAITGVNGFLGSAIYRELTGGTPNTIDMSNIGAPGPNVPAEVVILDGDVRSPHTFQQLDHTFDYLFHFAAPSSQILFKRNPEYCIDSTIGGLVNAAQACRKHGIRLIYPSTGLLSQDRYNEYAMCKKLSEEYVRGLGIDALGIRIFATYGPGERHKRDYASVPYLFARDMAKGKTPIIFGDGEQVRDFIYIDDVVRGVLVLAEECDQPVIDLGYGGQLSFNRIIDIINWQLGTSIKPEYVDAPKGYVTETGADISVLRRYMQPQVDMEVGIANMVKAIKDEL